MNRWKDDFQRNLFTLEDETNPASSGMEGVWPETTLDAVIDQNDPLHKSLREILDDLRQEILTGGQGTLVFPVTSVNGLTGDVTITPAVIGLGLVDNTRDVDKPLSAPQRNAINDILKNYNFRVNLDELYNHLKDTSNPHAVTVETINQDNALETFIKRFISIHNYDTGLNTHPDIRNSIISLLAQFDTLKTDVNGRVNTIASQLYQHESEPTAHQALFDKKEDTQNKVTSFTMTENASYSKYPSTRAVVDHVTARLTDFKAELPDVKNWIDDLLVVWNRDEMPDATSQTHRKAVFIINGDNRHEELAVCRYENGMYRWDYEDLGIPTAYDPTYFTETSEGITLRLEPIAESIFGDGEVFGDTLKRFLEGYYTKEEIDEHHWISGIHIITGQEDGCIRFYVNNDPATVSSDIHVAGLGRIAFLEYVTENEIFDQAVHERHILNSAVVTRHIRDKNVTAKKIACSYGKVIGNSADPDGNQANEVPMWDLALPISPERIREIVDYAWDNLTEGRFTIIPEVVMRWYIGLHFNAQHVYDQAYPQGLFDYEIDAVVRRIIERWYEKYDVKGNWVSGEWALEVFTLEEVADIVNTAIDRYFWILEKVEEVTLNDKDMVRSQFMRPHPGYPEDNIERIADEIYFYWWENEGQDRWTPNFDTLEPFTPEEIEAIIDQVFAKAEID